MTREEARKNLEELYMHLQTSPAISAKEYRTAVKLAIEALQERPKGRWIKATPFSDPVCSYCGRPPKILFGIQPPFCPNCGKPMEIVGADMRSE